MKKRVNKSELNVDYIISKPLSKTQCEELSNFIRESKTKNQKLKSKAA